MVDDRIDYSQMNRDMALRQFAANLGMNGEELKDLAFNLNIYNSPSGYTPRWSQQDSVYNYAQQSGNNFTGYTGPNYSAGFFANSTGYVGSSTSGFLAGSTGMVNGGTDMWKLSIDNTTYYNPKSKTNTDNAQANNSQSKDNKGYTYEIDKEGCITYKDPNGKKITVTEMKKHAPELVEKALKESKHKDQQA